MVDIWVMFIAGVLGFFLRTSGYSIPSLILGVILGSLGESFFVKSIQLMNYNWWGYLQSPISAVLIIGGFAAVTLNALSAFKKAFSKEKM